jgi:hypothetical protein
MLHEDQVLMVDDGIPGERLSDGWVVPAPLRRIVETDGGLHLSLWKPGLPELCAGR